MERLLLLSAVSFFAVSQVDAQLINQEFPFQNNGSSFFEQNGVSWSLRGPGGFFWNFGGNAVAPFGNPDPNAGLRTGFGFNRGGFSGNFGLTLNQGSSRSSVTTAPSVTTTNGIPGTISDQTLRPFVTSVTPVVGGGVLLPQSQQTNETQQFLQSYQHAQNTHVQQRRIANANVKQERAYTDFERGLKAEEEGNLKMARANYRNALGAAQGQLRIEILKRMRARGW